MKHKNIIRIRVVLMIALLGMSLFPSIAQQKIIEGIVTSGVDNTPLPGVAILIKGANSGSFTDIKGHFRITTKLGQALIFSATGFLSQNITVDSKNHLEVKMHKQPVRPKKNRPTGTR